MAAHSTRSSNAVLLPDRRECGRRPAAKREPGLAPIEQWAAAYTPKTSSGYDDALAQLWRLCDRHVITRDEAEARDIALRRARYALGEGREAQS